MRSRKVLFVVFVAVAALGLTACFPPVNEAPAGGGGGGGGGGFVPPLAPGGPNILVDPFLHYGPIFNDIPIFDNGRLSLTFYNTGFNAGLGTAMFTITSPTVPNISDYVDWFILTPSVGGFDPGCPADPLLIGPGARCGLNVILWPTRAENVNLPDLIFTWHGNPGQHNVSVPVSASVVARNGLEACDLTIDGSNHLIGTASVFGTATDLEWYYSVNGIPDPPDGPYLNGTSNIIDFGDVGVPVSGDYYVAGPFSPATHSFVVCDYEVP